MSSKWSEPAPAKASLSIQQVNRFQERRLASTIATLHPNNTWAQSDLNTLAATQVPYRQRLQDSHARRTGYSRIGMTTKVSSTQDSPRQIELLSAS
jgi:hypothetical protein